MTSQRLHNRAVAKLTEQKRVCADCGGTYFYFVREEQYRDFIETGRCNECQQEAQREAQEN